MNKKRQWLIELRKNVELTQEQVAERANIERSTYTKAENGNSVSVTTAKSIAKVFNFDWTIFFEEVCDFKGQKFEKQTG